MEPLKKLRAGLLVRSKQRYLLLHVTKRDGCTATPLNCRGLPHWSCSKGGVEQGETFLEAALREFAEETGLDLCSQAFNPTWQCQQAYASLPPEQWSTFPHGFSFFTPKGDKVLLYCIDDVDGKIYDYTPTMICKSMVAIDFPEHDAFAWFTAEQAVAVALTTQQHIFADKQKLEQHFIWNKDGEKIVDQKTTFN